MPEGYCIKTIPAAQQFLKLFLISFKYYWHKNQVLIPGNKDIYI